MVSDLHGKPLRPIKTLKHGYSIVTAGTKELHAEILSRVQG